MQQVAAAEIESEQPGQPQQGRRCIAATTTQTCAYWNGFFELCRQSPGHASVALENLDGANHQIVRRIDCRFIGAELDASAFASA